MRRNYLKDLKWHILMTIISIFFICKYSSAPPIFDALNIIFQRPEENTFMYELIRIAENVSLAYIASLVFYLLVDYIPLIKEENNTLHLLEKYLCPLYMYMDKVNSYFRYATGISNIQAATNEEVKTIDDFSFKNSAEFLMIKSIRDGKDDGEHVDAFEAKKSIVFCGQKIMECIHNIDCNGVQREHNKKLNNGLPILHKVPPKRDYGRYFCILAEKGGISHGGLTEKLSPFFYAQKQEVNAYGR